MRTPSEAKHALFLESILSKLVLEIYPLVSEEATRELFMNHELTAQIMQSALQPNAACKISKKLTQEGFSFLQQAGQTLLI